MSEITITGLDLTKIVMRDQSDDIAYIALSEINEKNRPVGAARVDFSAVGLGVSTPPSPSCAPHRSRVKRPCACTRSTARSPWPAATAAA